ncbi:uncharacterized protein LOC109863181 isoform X1 [Pseudomyrmex gracilis]|uniref:uncharacterized protein LOC109863181 isoform X1 n=1 Tax=Pseudomyrmex gracilis TaxID=219809 RepID=UPI000995D5DB|nr:uncharacterized protein LOC109863181 isoform X1 [Pseudomyrmex gracilis]
MENKQDEVDVMNIDSNIEDWNMFTFEKDQRRSSPTIYSSLSPNVPSLTSVSVNPETTNMPNDDHARVEKAENVPRRRRPDISSIERLNESPVASSSVTRDHARFERPENVSRGRRPDISSRERSNESPVAGSSVTSDKDRGERGLVQLVNRRGSCDFYLDYRLHNTTGGKEEDIEGRNVTIC